jgi:hypothetical protein
MVQIPEKVMQKLADPATAKVLVTASSTGRPHAIVCGSIAAPSNDKIVVGEILMKRAAANLKANSKAAILIVNGMESYEIILKDPVRIAEGPVLDGMNEKLAAIKLHANAVWMFDVCSVMNQSASPEAGTKIA